MLNLIILNFYSNGAPFPFYWLGIDVYHNHNGKIGKMQSIQH